MARNEMGWLGWFCVADFVILAGLYVIAMVEPELWQFSMMWTGIIALLAGLGAIAFWFGDDPTAPEETDVGTTRRT